MDVEVELQQDDLMAFYRLVLQNSKEARRLRLKSRVGAIVTLLGFWALVLHCYYRIGMIESIVQTVLFFILFAAVVIPAVIALDRILPKRRLGRMVSEDPSLVSRRNYSLKEDGMAFQGNSESGRTTWNGVKDVVETEGHIFVLLGKYRAYILPKRAFATPEQAGQFFELAREYKAAHG